MGILCIPIIPHLTLLIIGVCIITQNLLQELKMLKHRVDELEQEKMQYEQKLKVTQVLPHTCDCVSQRHKCCPKVVVHRQYSNIAHVVNNCGRCSSVSPVYVLLNTLVNMYYDLLLMQIICINLYIFVYIIIKCFYSLRQRL